MNIILDAMSGDKAPLEIIKGAVLAREKFDASLTLVGDIPAMEKIAAENGWKIVEISLRAENASRHRMFYEAGVEQFLSLVKHAAFMVTNSYHGMIFALHHRRPFCVFSREQCDTKIAELLNIIQLNDRFKTVNDGLLPPAIDYDAVHARIALERERSLRVMEDALNTLYQR